MPSVLVVDDSTSVRQMVGFTLKQIGFEPTEAEDGAVALQVAGSQGFDLVITDLNMPNLDGIELIKALRQQEKHKYIPILMLTTESQDSKKQEGKAVGATGWIVKPFRPDQLQAVVQKVMG